MTNCFLILLTVEVEVKTKKKERCFSALRKQPVVMINGCAVLRFTAYLIFVKNEPWVLSPMGKQRESRGWGAQNCPILF